jgi:hypothetical protein
MRSSSNLQTGFSVLRLAIDPLRGTSIPVGAVVWDADRKWYKVRLLQQDERVDGMTPERRLLVEFMGTQLTRWAERRIIPYLEQPADPWSSKFWDGVKRALTTGVRLDTLKAMQPVTSDADLELLFEAVVQPGQRSKQARTRIEGALRNALGRSVDKAMKPRFSVRAYHNAREQVLRGAKGDYGVVLVEAVNLAGKHARRDADALVSRLLRIRAAMQDQTALHTIVGYTASPGGLNGETHMKDWIAERITSDVYDLTRESESFRGATVGALADVGILNPGMM